MRLTDTGQTVTLDLHGARVDEALRMARKALALSAQRGRRRLDLIHGSSTTDAHGTRRTIKTALHEWIDGPAARHLFVQAQRGDAVLTLHLDLTRRASPTRIALRDVWP